MYYDLSISFPYLFLITPLSFYSMSFYSISVLQSIFFSVTPSSLIILLPSHSLSLFIIFLSFFLFIPFHIILSHSILILSFIYFHFNATVLSSSSSLFYKPLSLIRFSTSFLFSSLFPYIILFQFYSSYCFSSPLSLPLSSSIFINAQFLLFLLFSPIIQSLYSFHLLLYHSYSFPYSISFNHFFRHIINHFLLLFPIYFNHSFFNKHNNQISTYSYTLNSFLLLLFINNTIVVNIIPNTINSIITHTLTHTLLSSILLTQHTSLLLLFNIQSITTAIYTHYFYLSILSLTFAYSPASHYLYLH